MHSWLVSRGTRFITCDFVYIDAKRDRNDATHVASLATRSAFASNGKLR